MARQKKEKSEKLTESKRFEPAKDVFPGAIDLVRIIAEENHADRITDLNVTISVLFAYAARDKNGMAKGPALMEQGHATESLTDIANAKSRADGDSMVKLTFDGDRWAEWTEDEQIACIDEALARVDVKLDEEGEPILDKLGRVELKKRMPDMLIKGYWEVWERNVKSRSRHQARVFTNEFPTRMREQYGQRNVGADTSLAGESEESGESEIDSDQEAI